MPHLAVQKPPRTIKRRTRTVPVPCLTELNLDLTDREKQATNIRQDAYKMARLFGRSIFQSLRDENKTGLREMVVNFGIASDKVLGGAESSGLVLTVPGALMDKFMLAVNIKSPPPIEPKVIELPSQSK